MTQAMPYCGGVVITSGGVATRVEDLTGNPLKQANTQFSPDQPPQAIVAMALEGMGASTLSSLCVSIHGVPQDDGSFTVHTLYGEGWPFGPSTFTLPKTTVLCELADAAAHGINLKPGSLMPLITPGENPYAVAEGTVGVIDIGDTSIGSAVRKRGGPHLIGYSGSRHYAPSDGSLHVYGVLASNLGYVSFETMLCGMWAKVRLEAVREGLGCPEDAAQEELLKMEARALGQLLHGFVMEHPIARSVVLMCSGASELFTRLAHEPPLLEVVRAEFLMESPGLPRAAYRARIPVMYYYGAADPYMQGAIIRARRVASR